MARVTIEGCKPGLNKVQLNHLLRYYGRYTIDGVKEVVERVLSGEGASIDCADAEAASSFCKSAGALGVTCRVSPESLEG